MVSINDIVIYDGMLGINNPDIESELREELLKYPKKYIFENHLRLRLDQIADMLYKNVNLWWVIAYYNAIEDPFSMDGLDRLYYIPKDDLFDIFDRVG